MLSFFPDSSQVEVNKPAGGEGWGGGVGGLEPAAGLLNCQFKGKKVRKMNAGTTWMSGSEAWLVIRKINPTERQALPQSGNY